MRTRATRTTADRIGIVAGAGIMPVEVAQAIVDNGSEVYVVIADKDGDAALKAFPHTYVYWSQLGQAIHALRMADVSSVVFVGRTSRPEMKTARPDLEFIKALPEVVRLLSQGGDDALLRCLIGIFEKRGLRVSGVRDVAPELLLADGRIPGPEPTERDQHDINLGLDVVAALGRFDIGQGVVTRDGKVIAIEGAEGTDRMLARVAQLTAAGTEKSGVLVKRPKPSQELRIDLPAIGPSTVQGAGKAHLCGVVGMAGYVLCAERERTRALADELGVFVLGTPVQDSGNPVGGETNSSFTAIPNARLRNDVEIGSAVLATLKSFACGRAAIVRGARVLAVAAGETPRDAIKRVYRRGWRRSGLVVLAQGEHIYENLLDAAAAAGLAGVVIAGDKIDTQIERAAASRKLKLFTAPTEA